MRAGRPAANVAVVTDERVTRLPGRFLTLYNETADPRTVHQFLTTYVLTLEALDRADCKEPLVTGPVRSQLVLLLSNAVHAARRQHADHLDADFEAWADDLALVSRAVVACAGVHDAEAVLIGVYRAVVRVLRSAGVNMLECVSSCYSETESGLPSAT